MASLLILDSQKYCVHQIFLYPQFLQSLLSTLIPRMYKHSSSLQEVNTRRLALAKCGQNFTLEEKKLCLVFLSASTKDFSGFTKTFRIARVSCSDEDNPGYFPPILGLFWAVLDYLRLNPGYLLLIYRHIVIHCRCPIMLSTFLSLVP